MIMDHAPNPEPTSPLCIPALVAYIERDIAAMEVEIQKLEARLEAKKTKLNEARALLVSWSGSTNGDGLSVEQLALQKKVLDLLCSAPGREWSVRQVTKLFKAMRANPRDVRVCLQDLCRQGTVTRKKLESGHVWYTFPASADPTETGSRQDESRPPMIRSKRAESF
jgi:hypothetical protein